MSAAASRDGRLTLMAVHAHPDDEAVTTGGLLARSAAEGIRTVLVTCTNGEMGDGPGGVKPGEPGHDEAAVAATRREELDRACRILSVGHLEMLGYRDSGMAGWDGNRHDDAFANASLDDAAGRLAGLVARYRPDVVVTYDENGNYGHPDHVQAHRVTVAALAAAASPARLYYSVIPRSLVAHFAERMQEMGLDPGGVDLPRDDAGEVAFGTPDEMLAAVVDVAGFADLKREALAAHASQSDSAFLLGLPPDAFRAAFGREYFVRHGERTPASVHDDLFVGLR